MFDTPPPDRFELGEQGDDGLYPIMDRHFDVPCGYSNSPDVARGIIRYMNKIDRRYALELERALLGEDEDG